jgi:uncharacterized protein YjbJ (UPF0337 family)
VKGTNKETAGKATSDKNKQAGGTARDASKTADD